MRRKLTIFMALLGAFALIPSVALARGGDDDHRGDKPGKNSGTPGALGHPAHPPAGAVTYLVHGTLTAAPTPGATTATLAVSATKANAAAAAALAGGGQVTFSKDDRDDDDLTRLAAPKAISVLVDPTTRIVRTERHKGHHSRKGKGVTTGLGALKAGDELTIQWKVVPPAGALNLSTVPARKINARGAKKVEFKVKGTAVGPAANLPNPGGPLVLQILVTKANKNAIAAFQASQGGAYNAIGTTLSVIIGPYTKVKVKGHGHHSHKGSKLARVVAGQRVTVEWKDFALSTFWLNAAKKVEVKRAKS